MPTGDLARRLADGRFVLLGRADDVVKFEDKRVSFSEMQARLMQHDWVEDARLLLLPGRRELIGAVVVLNGEGRAAFAAGGKAPVRDALRAWLSGSYESLLIPRKWRFPERLPDNEMGKTQQSALLRLFEDKP
jgi:acyl-coenzyme A synthetase/AMP-(fatty) acid ligase